MPSTCSHCGKANPDGVRFCGYCGFRLPQIAPAQGTNPAPAANRPAARRFNWAAFAGLLVCIAFIFFGIQARGRSQGMLSLMVPTPTRTPRPTRTPTLVPSPVPIATEAPAFSGPYAEGMQTLVPDLILGASFGLLSPRGVAVAPDGTVFVTDSGNHRVLHFSADGTLLNGWGGPGDGSGEFNDPWGIAVGPDGAVYVADTWNHRIQKFSAEGRPIMEINGVVMNGGSDTLWFWGPRDIVFDEYGRLLVTDTGNERVLVLSPETGEYFTHFGSEGSDLGQLSEAVGLAFCDNNVLYITDTWNQRVLAFTHSVDGISFHSQFAWPIFGWNGGESIENKPYIAASPEGTLLITDPYDSRVLEFTRMGDYLRGWDASGEKALFNGIDIDSNGDVWVTDAVNNRVLRFRR